MNSAPIRLRRLEVQGFKSFATRTAFEFGPGITAIVGPNGSGKSNLADALRWVLGEQNPRALRLRRGEDVIFAGGGKRAQSGFAEVSIVLDNAEGWLPIEFQEVAVTRRLHRSGEGEYLLNRRRARLRDILDLFLRARLGQNSYAILGQGMVDVVLSLRPEERRALIEEAADVRRHRLKIDEATDQLAATRENRDRVELLLAEIGPRLSQLERQAARATEHAALSRNLAGIINLLYTGRLRSTRAAVDSAQEMYRAVALQADEATAAMGAAEEYSRAIEQEAKAALVDLQHLVRWHRELEEKQLSARRAVDGAADRVPYLESRLREAHADLLTLEQEADTLEAQPKGISPAAALDEADAAMEAAELVLAEAAGRVEQARARLAAAEAEQRVAEQRRTAGRQALLQIEAERHSIAQNSERLVQRRREALNRLKLWGREYLDAQGALSTLRRHLDAAGSALTDQRRRSQIAGSAVSDGETALADLSVRIESTERKLNLLQREQEARRPAEEVIVALLDALRGGGPGRPRVLGIIGGLVHVQRGYEAAVEAALAESLNGLVVRTEREALGAVGVLQQIEAGRVNFFVLEGLRGAHTLNIANENGVLGVAARFVRCDDEYRDLLDSLLGRIIVVEDLDAARRVVRRGLGSSVTLDGTFFRSTGMIAGGRGKSVGGIFQADRELNELREESTRLGVDFLGETDQVEQLRAQAADARGRTQDAEDLLGGLLEQAEAAESVLAELRRRLEPMRGELEWAQSALLELEARRSTLDSIRRADDSAAPTAANDKELNHLAGSVAQAASELDLAVAVHAAAGSACSEARGARSALLSERAALEALHESRSQAQSRALKMIETRRASLELLERERQTAQLELQFRMDELANADKELTGALGKLEPAREGLQLLVERQRGLADSLSAARDDSARAERVRLDAELAVLRARESLERLSSELDAEGLSLEGVDGSLGPEPEPSPEEIRELEARIRGLRRRIRDLGAVNEEAETDYRENRERHDFLAAQVSDLREAETALLDALDELRQIVRERFRSTFQSINADFQVYFRTFFGGGQARLALTEPEDYGESGVDIIAQPPGKRLQNLAMLSGGERSMTAVALLFALLESNPAPFCVLDEVDAALDEANVGRFSEALARLAGRSQFLVITHNRGTVQAADQIYGVSMAADGVSTVLSMRLSEATPLLA